MTKDHTTRRESDTVEPVDGGIEVEPRQFKVSIEDGSVCLHLDHGVIDVKNGTLAFSVSAGLVQGDGSLLKLDQAEDILAIRDRHVGISHPSTSALVETGILQGHTLGGLTAEEPLAVASATRALLVESGIARFGAENMLEMKDGAFTVQAVTGPLLAESAVLQWDAERMFSIKEGAFTVGSTVDPFVAGIGHVQASAETMLTTQYESSFTASPSISLPSESNAFQIDVGNAFAIKDGAFAIAPTSEFPLAGGSVLESHMVEDILTVRNGVLIARPTYRLVMGESDFLRIDQHKRTLTIREEALGLATQYTGDVHLIDRTKEILSSIEWPRIGDALGVNILDRTSIQDGFLGLSNSYSDLFVSIGNTQPSFCSLPSSISIFPADEYFRSASLLKQATSPWGSRDYPEDRISEKGPESTASDPLQVQLEGMDANFGTMLKGAVQALRSDNPDKARHFSISLRELFTHVLHKLSPDDDLRKWSNNRDDYHNDRPTRRARLKYICRNINETSFESFVEADTKTSIKFLRLFHGGTHSTRPGYSDPQLKAMLVRMKGLLSFLIEVAKA